MKLNLRPANILFFGLTVLMTIIIIGSFIAAIKWVNRPFAGFLLYDFPLTGSMSLSDWPGRKAGLQILDRVVSFDNQEIKESRDLVRAVGEKKPGTPVLYVIESKDGRRQFSLPVINFGLREFFLVFFMTFLGGAAVFCLGCIAYVLKPNVRTSWVFYLYCFFLSMYMVTSFETQSSYLFVHFHYFALCLMSAVLFHLGLIFPDRKRILNRMPALEYVIYAPALLLAIVYQIFLFSFSDPSGTGLLSTLPDYIKMAKINRIFTLFCVAGMIVSVFHSIFTSPTILGRQRGRMILFGVTLAFLPSVTIMLLITLLKVNFPMNFLVFFVLFFPASIAYSIVKHNLFDADTIIKRTVGYIVTTGIVVGAYAAVSITLNVLLGRYELTESQAFPVLFTLGVILVFNPLRNRIQSLVDRLFFRKEYNYQETVQKIIETMRSLLNQDQICRGIMKFALEPMFVDSGSVMILNKDKKEYECFIQTAEKWAPESATDVAVKAIPADESAVFDDEVKKEGPVPDEGVDPAQEAPNLILSAEDPLIRKIAELKKEVTLYDIQEDPLFEADREACEQVFERLGATLVVPLIYEDRLTGMISLGQKKSGKFYRREDINLLNTLAGQGALAVENARMVDEIIEKERMRTKIMDAFGKYVTPEVRDQILEGNIPLDGESKEVTVLFADLRDFTTLAESTTPKEVVRIINGYFSEMADAIGQNHGLVLQFIGDEIEAVFGAPLPLEDHSTHAFRAALAMRQRLVVVNEKLEQQGYGPLRHGIGIHTGTVVAANIGSEDRLSYAMVGDTVNLASRIQGLNKEFGTDLLISATTVDRLSDDLAIEKLPATTVKGKRNPVEVYKLK